jgi:tryptophan synthase alpha chain
MEPILPFLMAGDPSLEHLSSLLAECQALGIGTVEVGLPHSDPVADGPVLQAAAHRALERGVSTRRVLEALQGLPGPDVVLFTYFNPLLQLGDELDSLLAGTPVKSLLVVDLPYGEEPAWEERLRSKGYPIVPLLTPTTPLDRARRLLASRPDPGPDHPFAQRFAYVVARLGVTGTGQGTDLVPVAQRLEALNTISDRPLAVGFGLDDPASLAQVRAMGAVPVVGSALVKALAQGTGLAAFLGPRLGQAEAMR